MSLRLAGLGWVTPLGSGLDEVWERLRGGAEAEPVMLESSLGKQGCLAFNVPAAATADASRFPRLRRSSAISRFAVVAGLHALIDAGLTLDESSAARTALVFAISNGGVAYTKRFYHEIAQQGAVAASPLLFPETVFNAPASHLAAVLGITGASYTLVGDSAVAILALRMAQDLMSNRELDRCLVVGAEEADWLLCDAYRKWRLLRATPPIEPFSSHSRGMILSEGAGAVVLAQDGEVILEKVHPGANFAQQNKLVRQLEAICDQLQDGCETDLLIASANGTFVDKAEMAAARKYFSEAAIYTPKPALGEGVAAGSMWQVICAALALRKQELPPLLHAPDSWPTNAWRPREKSWHRAIVTTCGLNQQVAGCALRV